MLLLLGLLIALSGAAEAAASSADDYTNAVHRALTLVQFAERGDVPRADYASYDVHVDFGRRISRRRAISRRLTVACAS